MCVKKVFKHWAPLSEEILAIQMNHQEQSLKGSCGLECSLKLPTRSNFISVPRKRVPGRARAPLFLFSLK